MLYRKRPAIFLVFVVLYFLTGCSSSQLAKNLQRSLAADPRLTNSPSIFAGNQPGQTPAIQLPADFPSDIPIYSGAILQEVTPASGTDNTVKTRWLSSDPSNFIANFYQKQFQSNNWQILQQPADGQTGVFQARRNNLLVKVSIQPQPITNPTPNQSPTATQLLIDYTPNADTTPQASPSPTTQTPDAQVTDSPVASNIPQPGDPQFIGPVPSATSSPISSPTSNSQNSTTSAETFTDINQAPQQLQQYIQQLAALGVFSPDTKANKNQFEPNKIITRRQYAAWLVAANNTMYASNPAKQIRLASPSDQPAFSDVSAKDPDFGAIQGLAEAGLIPSPLSGDSVDVLFRPDAPLTRENLILWKLPLDTRQPLPKASLDAIKQTWGFQDAGKIDPQALRAVLADYQNGEQSNIRRAFGYTTLFQPKKPVTRAEAAAVLWSFGTQGDAISAADALKVQSSGK